MYRPPGYTVCDLYTAIANKQRGAVELLLDRGANIEALLEAEPLLWAFFYAESEDLASLLLDRGASAHAVTAHGSTALHLLLVGGFSSSWAG